MIPIAKPVLGDAECKAAEKVIRSGWVTQGPCVQQFEANFAAHVASPYACAVSNCTTALHLSLLALGVGAGDVVITASHSFIATANSVRMCNAEPVFADIGLDSYNISVESVQKILDEDFVEQDGSYYYKKLNKLLHSKSSPLHHCAAPLGRLGAILVVHQVGMPTDMQGFMSLAKNINVPLIEDAACACGSKVLVNGAWDYIGQPHSAAACFSFHPRKLLSTGDGGIITTKSKELDAHFRLLRQHGMSISDATRHNAKSVVFEEYVEAAYNYRMTDIQAAIGIEQLHRLQDMVIKRREIADIYFGELANLPDFFILPEPNYAKSNWQTFLLQLHDSKKQLPFMQYMLECGIATRRGIMCAHREAPYVGAWDDKELPHSATAQDCCVAIPLFMQMTELEIEKIIENIKKFFKSV